MRQMCIYCFKWADMDTMTPIFEQGREFVNIIVKIVLMLLWIICLNSHTNMQANHQESTSIKICDLIVKRVCWNSITKGHLKREGLFCSGFY